MILGRIFGLLLSELLVPGFLKVLHNFLVFVHIFKQILHVAQTQFGEVDVVAACSSKFLQDLLELLVFVLKLANNFVLGTLVDEGLVFDFFGTVRVPQRAQRLFAVHERRRQSANHDGLRVASQRRLQNTCQR